MLLHNASDIRGQYGDRRDKFIIVHVISEPLHANPAELSIATLHIGLHKPEQDAVFFTREISPDGA